MHKKNRLEVEHKYNQCMSYMLYKKEKNKYCGENRNECQRYTHSLCDVRTEDIILILIRL